MTKGTGPKRHTWRESARGSGIWILGPVDGPHVVQTHSVAGGPWPWIVWGIGGPQIDLSARTRRDARAAGELALRTYAIGKRRRRPPACSPSCGSG